MLITSQIVDLKMIGVVLVLRKRYQCGGGETLSPVVKYSFFEYAINQPFEFMLQLSPLGFKLSRAINRSRSSSPISVTSSTFPL